MNETKQSRLNGCDVHGDDRRRHVTSRNLALHQRQLGEAELRYRLSIVERGKVKVDLAVVLGDVQRVVVDGVTACAETRQISDGANTGTYRQQTHKNINMTSRSLISCESL